MSPASTLDEFERDIARTLRAKADQLDVPVDTFDPAGDPRPLAAVAPARPYLDAAVDAAKWVRASGIRIVTLLSGFRLLVR